MCVQKRGQVLLHCHRRTIYCRRGHYCQPQRSTAKADIVLSLSTLSGEDIALLKPGAVLLGVYQPLFNYSLMAEWAAKGLSVFSIDMLPRTPVPKVWMY